MEAKSGHFNAHALPVCGASCQPPAHPRSYHPRKPESVPGSKWVCVSMRCPKGKGVSRSPHSEECGREHHPHHHNSQQPWTASSGGHDQR